METEGANRRKRVSQPAPKRPGERRVKVAVIVAAAAAGVSLAAITLLMGSREQRAREGKSLATYERAVRLSNEAEYGAAIVALDSLNPQKLDPSLKDRVQRLRRKIRRAMRLSHGERLIETRQYDKATVVLKNLLADFPDDADAARLMAKIPSAEDVSPPSAVDAGLDATAAVAKSKVAVSDAAESPPARMSRPRRRLRRRIVPTRRVARPIVPTEPAALARPEPAIPNTTPATKSVPAPDRPKPRRGVHSRLPPTDNLNPWAE